MSKDRNTIAPQIIDEASEWFVILREADTCAEDRAAFAEWLRASPVHVGAYLEIARLWTDASHVDPKLPVDAEGTRATNVIELPQSAAGTSPSRRLRAQARRGPRRLSIALAGSVLLALACGGAWLYVNRAPTYVTDIGEQRTITLEDGSIVRLNSRSELKVRLSPEMRRIELVAGQALFEVAHDASRPFIVTGGNSAIRAVGTQFDVNRKRSGTTVTVIEGRVRLDHVESASAPMAGVAGQIYLAAGEQMVVTSKGVLERTATPNTAAAIAWLQQELIFEGAPLADVVEEFNRYTRTPIILGDPSLADLRINAVFLSTSPDSLLRFISRYDSVKIDRAGDEIRITRRK